MLLYDVRYTQVKVLFEENNLLDEENKKLLLQYRKERNHHGSSGKHTSSASAKVRHEITAFWCLSLFLCASMFAGSNLKLYLFEVKQAKV